MTLHTTTVGPNRRSVGTIPAKGPQGAPIDLDALSNTVRQWHDEG